MNICVVGTGYVGLVTGAVFADLGNDVVCVDKIRAKIDSLKAGQMPIYEPGLEEMVARNVEDGRLAFTTELPAAVRQSDVIFIAVGTPAAETRRDRPLAGGGGGRRDRPRHGPLQGRREQVHRAGGNGRAGPRGHRPAPAAPRRVRRGLQPGVPPRGLRHRGHPPAGPHRDRRRQPARGDEARGALRPARAADDHHRPALGGGHQVRLQRLPRRQDLLHQRHRQRLRVGGRRRDPGDEGHGARRAHRRRLPPGRASATAAPASPRTWTPSSTPRAGSATTSSCSSRWWTSTASGRGASSR